ncbi:hypothetical protein ACKI1I_37815 [Streptomyces turgidiscabies]|uniref:Uncharacterized protein n=1 Tax=Streptomyces turgidiscabies (strain Car8) TaxID=698760 RepID=L7F9W9_STRT8|nr:MULTISPECIES: hypothetical protein [Streptomyces]ELP68022.1 hypothetical protein STRTUCAR8_05793 [Streptomyces turgidiscabies Car8]MDX3500180.1 hypothetical protein [Streptomyces turgidiscabies]GAQ77293.1 hypothetical protein T45_09111 [Streptomyces turgidiscabies]
MAIDPYAILRALLRAEAARNTPKAQGPLVPQMKEAEQQRPPEERGR